MNEVQQAIEFIKVLNNAFTNQRHKPQVLIRLHHQEIRHLSVIMSALKEKERAAAPTEMSSQN